MTPDNTLLARLLLSGAAVELPLITATTLHPCWGGYHVAIYLGGPDVQLVQWCKPHELDDTVLWMVTTAWAMNQRASNAQAQGE